jgi:hypothetical protein
MKNSSGWSLFLLALRKERKKSLSIVEHSLLIDPFLLLRPDDISNKGSKRLSG